MEYQDRRPNLVDHSALDEAVRSGWLSAAQAAWESVSDSYTPFGYLQNPFHVARDYSHTYGGNVRSSPELVGCGWVYPTERVAQSEVACGIGLQLPNEQPLRCRNDFAPVGYDARFHSMSILSYNLQLRQRVFPEPEAQLELDHRYFLADENVLVGLLTLINHSGILQRLRLLLIGQATSRTGHAFVCWARAAEADEAHQDARKPPGDVLLLQTEQTAVHEVRWLTAIAGNASAGVQVCWAAQPAGPQPSPQRVGVRVQAELPVDVVLPARAEVLLLFSLRRQSGAVFARPPSPLGEPEGPSGSLPHTPLPDPVTVDLQRWLKSYQDQLAADRAFRQVTPTLEGDWPDAWRHSFVYDWETTRLCVMPPGGIFHGPWPTWMQAYPRAVLAEGTLDMARLSYADPQLAKEALLSLFRDTPGPNVPCVHQGGEFNMVADDGSRCGTSPAWCLPFYNLYLVYLRTLDTEWVQQLYPHLVAYVEWWLAHRTDADGWLVYKCTWEAGEDNTPRLDPEQSGSNVVSGIVRPVELQAAMAQSARVLAIFAQVCGEPATVVDRWHRLAEEFTAKTRALWDAESGRFRDIDKRTGHFLVWTPPTGNSEANQRGQEGEARTPAEYWGTDPLRFSALSLTPLVLDIASPDQARVLAAEMPYYAREPWTIWPSWAYVIHEAWLWGGFRQLAAETAYSIVDRVYRENDRRTLTDAARPLPGVAREYWPMNLSDFRGSEAYSWGATTASLLVRQVFGFWESEATERWEFRLSPCLPPALNIPGRRYTLRHLYYRGARLTLTLTVLPVSPLLGKVPPIEFEVQIEPPRHPGPVTVWPDRSGGAADRPVPASGDRRWTLEQGRTYRVVVTG